MTNELDQLYEFALTHGTDRETGLVWDVIGRDGTARRRSIRLWCQTEALRAHGVMSRRGGDSEALICKTVRNLAERFFSGCPAGGWIDQFDQAGAPAVGVTPRFQTSERGMHHCGIRRVNTVSAAAAREAVVWELMRRADTDTVLMRGIELSCGRALDPWRAVAAYRGPQMGLDL